MNRPKNCNSASSRPRACSREVTGSGPSTSASRLSGVSELHTTIVTRPATAIAKSMWNVWMHQRAVDDHRIVERAGARRCAQAKSCEPLNITPGIATSASSQNTLDVAATDDEKKSFSNRRPKKTRASALRCAARRLRRGV